MKKKKDRGHATNKPRAKPRRDSIVQPKFPIWRKKKKPKDR